MTKTPGGFATVLSIPVGTYQYKFIVDGNWKHAPAADVEKDEHGNLNNVIEVKPHVPGKLIRECICDGPRFLLDVRGFVRI